MSRMRLLDAFSLIIVLMCLKVQTTQSSEYSCINNNFTFKFTLSSSSHSALDSLSNCFLSQCNNNNDSCRSSQTPCFDYHTINNISYCAPASLCSILESCDNITNTCSSNTSVCVVNSCCQPKSVCLPLPWTSLCPSTTTTTSPIVSNTTIVSTNETSTSITQTSSACNGFLSETTYSTGSYPTSVAVADVNNDNKLDIIVANSGSDNVDVLLNTDNGTFLSQTTYSTGNGSDPISVAVVDVNNDNKPDIVVVNYYSDNVGVLLNTGYGTFLSQTTYSTGTGSGPHSVAVVDVNSDNKLDIIVANHISNNVGVLLNTGNGTFLSQTTYSTDSQPISVAVVDINNDNKPDIVVANYNSNNVSVLLNAGNGTFLSQTTYSTGTGSSPYSVAVVDVNNDNKPDIIVANSGSDNVDVLLNTGNGTFLSQSTYSTGTGSGPISVAVVDVNNDNKPDIVVANYYSDNVGVLLNTGNGTFLSQIIYSTGNGSRPTSVAVVDVNNDNKPDIIVVNYYSSNVGVLVHC